MHGGKMTEEQVQKILPRMISGNRKYMDGPDDALRIQTAEHGQFPYAVVVCCSDSRVIPEKIFSAGIGELFVIRVAGNVLDKHQLGSIEYAAAHLGSPKIIVLGHTNCGAVGAALSGGGEGYIKYLTDEIIKAIGDERDPVKASCLNVEYAVKRLKEEFSDHPEVGSAEILGAMYDIRSGEVSWL